MNILARKRDLLSGLLIGAWLGGIYAWFSQWINQVFLPGVPLKPPASSLEVYIWSYIIVGALLGVISAIPEHRPAGMLLGGLAAAAGMAVLTFWRTAGTDTFGGAVITMLVAFLPLVVLMLPISLAVRFGVDAQHIPADEPHLWPRKFLIPFLLTLLALAIAALGLHSPVERSAFRQVDDYIRQSMAQPQTALPEPLTRVQGFAEKARGAYQLEYSDRIDTFMGPVPVGAELSYFLIIAEFENGFSFACVFSSNTNQPSCANYP